MANVTSIQLNFSDGTSQLVPVGPKPTSIDTPFGTIDMTGSQEPAPTTVGSTPGAFSGTRWDPITAAPPYTWDDEDGDGLVHLSHLKCIGDWYKDNPAQFFRYWQWKYGAPLDKSKLSAAQKKIMGIP